MKKIEKLVVSIPILLIICIVGSYTLGFLGVTYYKTDQGKHVYKFIEDMNGDGEKERVELINRYSSYDKKYTCDSMYTSNRIKIYLDGKRVYSDKLMTLGPLENPEIIDLFEGNARRSQIYIREHGGGPLPPLDYLFYTKDGRVVLNIVDSES